MARESAYFYHWTHRDALPSIRQHGLLPMPREGLYVSDDPRAWQDVVASMHGDNAVLLRFHRDAVRPKLVDKMAGIHVFVVHQSVPVDAIELQHHGRWVTLARENPIGRSFPEGPLEQHAADFARLAHERVGQKRKYTGDPYIVHPAAVADIVRSVPHDEAMLAAAWLHDTVEDTGVKPAELRAEFGDDVTMLVGWLTDVSRPEDGGRAARKEIDRQHTAQAPARAKTVKLADLINNSESILQHDPDFAVRYLREKRALLDVLHEGDPTLWQRADQLVNAGLKQLGIGVEQKAADMHLTARNQALVERYGQGTRMVVKIGKLPPEYRQAVAAYWEQPVENVPLDLPVGIATLPMKALTSAIMHDQDLAEYHGHFGPFHDWFMQVHGAQVPMYQTRWPVLLLTSDWKERDVATSDVILEDGWHRLHSYYEQGDKLVPAIWIIGFEASSPQHVARETGRDEEAQALAFIRQYGVVQTRDLFENGPLPTLAAAERVVERLHRKGLIMRTETARGGFAGWAVVEGPPVAGEAHAAPDPAAIIERAGILGTSGDCGAAAMAINTVVFDGKGQYLAAIPKEEMLESKQADIDHVGVLHRRKIYDADGVATTRDYLLRFSDGPAVVVNMDELMGREEAERVIRNSLPPMESYDEKVRKLTAAKLEVAFDPERQRA